MGETGLSEQLAAFVPAGRALRVGVMGGTFDPIHRAHVAAGVAARDELALDVVLFMPAGIPSFKRARHLASPSERLAMVRLALAGHARCLASDFELVRQGVTYTSETLRRLARTCPAPAELFFVMGADSLETLPLWHEAAEVVRLATIVVARRPGHDVAPALAALDASGLSARVCVLASELPDVSSTLVRSRVRAGLPVNELVGPDVADYIRARGLYRD